MVVYEGLHTYGGMAGRDMEAVAIGIEESLQDDHIRARIGQVQYLGEQAHGVGRPHRPARSADTASSSTPRPFCRTSPRSSSRRRRWPPRCTSTPASARWSAASCSAGRDPETGENRYPKLELVRLTIPRRVYTQAHMDVVAESVAEVYDEREKGQGPRMVYEPRYLRFFQARFEPVG